MPVPATAIRQNGKKVVKRKDKYLTHESPEVSKEELKRFDRIVGLKKYGNQLNPVTIHNIYRSMKSNKNWTDAEIRELQNIPEDPWLTTGQKKKKSTSGKVVKRKGDRKVVNRKKGGKVMSGNDLVSSLYD